MKILSIVLMFFAAVVCGQAAATVYVTEEASDNTASDIEKHAISLLVSCDYEAPVDVATEVRWKAALGGPNAHTIFDTPRKLTFTFSATGPARSQEVVVTEILIPVSAKRRPDYVLVMSEGRVRAFAKYHNQAALLALQKCLTIR